MTGILEQMQEQLNSAVDAASAQVYGTSKGTYEVCDERKTESEA